MLVYGMPPAEIALNLHTFTRSTSGSSLVAASALKYEYFDHTYMFCPVYSFLKESSVAVVNCHTEGQ